MKHAATQSLHAYWTWLCAGRAAPERSDIDPAAIRGVLADSFIVEIEDAATRGSADMPFRLSGTRVNALFTRELKGLSLPGLFREQDRVDVHTMMWAVLDDTRAVVAGVSAAPVGFEPLVLEMLLLPLRHNGKTHARLLGALSPASVPRWLGLFPVEPLQLKGQRVLDVEKPGADDPIALPGLRRGVERRSQAVRRGHFVVHEGGRRRGSDFATPE